MAWICSIVRLRTFCWFISSISSPTPIKLAKKLAGSESLNLEMNIPEIKKYKYVSTISRGFLSAVANSIRSGTSLGNNFFERWLKGYRYWLRWILFLDNVWSFCDSKIAEEFEFIIWVLPKATSNCLVGGGWPHFSLFVQTNYWRETQMMSSNSKSVAQDPRPF